MRKYLFAAILCIALAATACGQKDKGAAETSVEGAKVTLEYTGEIFDGENTQFAFVWKISDAE